MVVSFSSSHFVCVSKFTPHIQIFAIVTSELSIYVNSPFPTNIYLNLDQSEKNKNGESLKDNKNATKNIISHLIADYSR